MIYYDINIIINKNSLEHIIFVVVYLTQIVTNRKLSRGPWQCYSHWWVTRYFTYFTFCMHVWRNNIHSMSLKLYIALRFGEGCVYAKGLCSERKNELLSSTYNLDFNHTCMVTYNVHLFQKSIFPLSHGDDQCGAKLYPPQMEVCFLLSRRYPTTNPTRNVHRHLKSKEYTGNGIYKERNHSSMQTSNIV